MSLIFKKLENVYFMRKTKRHLFIQMTFLFKGTNPLRSKYPNEV